jgi:hypothetical protein
MSNASSRRRCEPLCYLVDGRDNHGRPPDTHMLCARPTCPRSGVVLSTQPCASMRCAAPTATRECTYPPSHSRARALLWYTLCEAALVLGSHALVQDRPVTGRDILSRSRAASSQISADDLTRRPRLRPSHSPQLPSCRAGAYQQL